MKTLFTPGPELPRLRHGAGFNWFDYLGMGGCYAGSPSYPLDDRVYPELDDRAGWDALLGELTRLRPGLLRFGMPPDPHLDPDGKLVTDTVHLERLRRVSRWARAHDAIILLDTFLLPRRHAVPPIPVAHHAYLQYAAADNRAYAREFVAPLLRFLADQADLSAVRYFNPVNEPMCYGIYQAAPGQGDVWDCYVGMYREMRAALDDAGVPRTRIGLAGIDHTSPSPMTMLELMERTPAIDPYVDAYTIHYYYLRFDHQIPRPLIAPSAPIEDGMDRQTAALVRTCRRRGKPLLAAEVGTFYNGWRNGDPAGVASRESTLIVAEAVIRGLNIGLDGFCFWSLLNPNTIDGHFAIIGVDHGKLVRHGWPARIYGTLTQNVRPGSVVFPLVPVQFDTAFPYVHAVALRHADGTRSILCVNDHPGEAAAVEFRLPTEYGALPTTLHHNGEPTPVAVAASVAGAILVPPMTFAVWSDEPNDEPAGA